MRKATLIVTLLAALGLGGMAALHLHVNGQRDQVVITEQVLCGDKAVAEGLEVTSVVDLDRRLHWETVYTVGAQPETRTEFEFTEDQRLRPVAYEPAGIYVYDLTSTISDAWEEDEKELTGLAKAYQELFDETEPGTEGERDVRVADYLDYYPVSLSVELPNYDFDSRWDGFHASNDEQKAEMMALDQALQDYIRVPVLENEYVEISVHKNGDGSRSGWGSGTTSSTAGHDRYDMTIYNALTDSACYFIVDNRSYRGEIVDFSGVQGGYGIHILPFTASESRYTRVDVAGLSIAYPLDEASAVEWFDHTPDGERLLLCTREEDGSQVLRVIRAGTMEPLQELELTHDPELEFYHMDPEDGYLVLRSSDRDMVLLEEQPDGTYVRRFTVSETGNGTVDHNVGRGVTLWDGEKLVSVTEGSENCDFAVAVYDETGLRYCAGYRSSLDTGSYEFWEDMNCFLSYGDDSLKARWAN